MKIDIYKIIAQANAFANMMLVEQMKKDNTFSVHSIASVSAKNIMKSEYAYEFTANLIIGAISEYHEQLRKILKDRLDIEIDDIDIDTD